jgi:NCS1 family nucleobase:cation symporter-1
MPVLFLLSVISHNALNLYGAVLSIITLVQTFAYRWIPTAKSRAVIFILVLAACAIAVVFASKDFIGHFVDMVLAYAVGIAVQIAFMNTPLYVGPISEHLNGVDLSWVVGSPLYFWLASRDSAYKRRINGGKVGGGGGANYQTRRP